MLQGQADRNCVAATKNASAATPVWTLRCQLANLALASLSSWGRPSKAVRSGLTNPLGNAWFVHRRRFDQLLQSAARQAGALWIDTHVGSVSFDSVGASVLTGNARVSARWLVIATGSLPSAARITKQKPQNLDSLIAFWAHIPTLFEARMIFVEPTDNGWWYVCPDDGQGAIACFVTDGESSRSLSLRNATNWDQFFRTTSIHRELRFNTSPAFVNVAPIGLGAIPKKCGENWIVTGDAAVKLDPIGSSGTATALDSGHRAAKAVSDALRGEMAKLAAYENWSSSLFQAFIKQRERQYAIERFKRPSAFWSHRELQAV